MFFIIIMNPKSRCICSVPQCKSYAIKGISLHKFPKNLKLSKQWATVLRIGKNISKYMLVCSLHFEEKDFHPTTPLKTKKVLKKNVVPSCNIPLRMHEVRKSNNARSERLQNRQKYVRISQSATAEDNSPMEPIQLPVVESETATCLDILAELCTTQTKLPTNCDKEVQVDTFSMFSDAVYGILQSDKLLVAYTGIDSDLFNCIVQRVEETITSLNLRNRNVTNSILLALIKLKLNVSFRVLSGLFQKSPTSLKRSFDDVIPLLSETLKCAIYLPTFEENVKNLPQCFNNYKKVRIILDCTEIPLQQPKCLKCRLRCYSYYKSMHTVKFLVGVNPAGIITYLSPAYGGKVSDKAIFNNEQIINLLEPYVDQIMVDKGFAIEKECAEAGITLVRPPFSRKAPQLSKLQAEKTASIARARVHVERAIQRLKVFKIFTEKISWNLLPQIDNIGIILAALVNLSNPILADDKF